MIKLRRDNSLSIEIENKLFKVLEVTVDFAKSQNLVLESPNEDKLVVKTVVEAFQRQRVAQLFLKTGWKLKTVFQYALSLPPYEVQKGYLQPVINGIEAQLTKTKILQSIDISFVPEFELFEFLHEKKWQFIDQEFPPQVDRQP